jgi:TatD DNase family protein
MYIDVHTHSGLKQSQGVIAIKNILIEEAEKLIPGDEYYSIGVHPWDTAKPFFNPDLPADFFAKPHFVAIGECGIDKLQALLSETHHKPLIIHCVRAWQEILDLKNEIRPKSFWIIHGFRGKPELAKQLVNSGFYLSFGESLINPKPGIVESFSQVPLNRLFLETDVSSHPIEMIYQAASLIKNIPLLELQRELMQNFEKVFGIYGTSRLASTN